MIDTHAHIHDEAFDKDRDAVVARAVAAGVTRIITIGTDPGTSRAAVACAEKYPEVFAVVGVHPNELPAQGGVDWEELKAIARSSKKVVGIGECGLDYYAREPQPAITNRQKTIQKEGFLAQIGLAKELALPLIVHCRPSVGTADAYEDMYEIAASRTPRNDMRIILHCYQGDTVVTEKFLAFPNVWFSFAGNVTYPVRKALAGAKPARIATPASNAGSVARAGWRSVAGGDDPREVVRMIPAERILVETDCPYLAPAEKRGKRNEPAFVTETAAFVAGLKGVKSGEWSERMMARAAAVFPFPA